MTGQDAVNVAESFAEVAEFDGVVITKLDGDARGGAALSVRAVTGKPIIYASTGEKLDELERFHPDRMAGRILGMGDVMSLIEKTEERVRRRARPRTSSRRSASRRSPSRTSSTQMKQVRSMGPLGNLMKMIPGMGGAMQPDGQGRRARARPPRGDHPLDDPLRARPSRARSTARAASGSRPARGPRSRPSTSWSSSSARCAS